ncbi:MAG TPA: hypothetical protein VGY57_10470 [Vicinamibacterales bacterium]|nr:hypothetical protein [Vicinamibacterales bacterium]
MSTRRYLIVATALYTLLTAAMTYPQALHLRDGVHDDGDPLLNAWALAWVAHQLPAAPAHLFDANIFYPERRTLAFSETLLAPAIAAAPLRWIGLGPILVYNIVFLSGFIVSGIGAALLVRELTGRPAAGILAGLIFAFLPYRIDHYAHLQLQQTQFLPFALWAFHRLLATGRMRDGVLFGLFTAGQALSCMYYGLFLVPYFIVVCGTLLIAQSVTRAKRTGRAIVGVLVAAAIATAAVLPVAKAYLGAREVVGERRTEEIAIGSATLWNYLGPPKENALFGSAFKGFADPERRLFPGFVAIGLAAIGAFVRWPRKHESHENTKSQNLSIRLAYLLGLLIAVDVSLGFNGFTFRVLFDYALPFRGLRVPARMGIFAGFSIAVLAGYGVAWMADRIRPPRAVGPVLAAIGVLIIAEYASRPLDIMIIPTSPLPVYADLTRDNGDGPTAALVEFPLSAADDPTYMYYSTFHWRNLVNGYSGFFPPWFKQFGDTLVQLPDDTAILMIKRHEAQYLVIHGERLYGARYPQLVEELGRRSDLKLISLQPAAREGQHGETALYRILY